MVMYCGRQAQTPTQIGIMQSNQRGSAANSGQASHKSIIMTQVRFSSKKATSPVVLYRNTPYMSKANIDTAIQPILERVVRGLRLKSFAFGDLGVSLFSWDEGCFNTIIYYFLWDYVQLTNVKLRTLLNHS